jgi:hypothetical protein
MSTIGYRKKGENGPLYNPERDYAYITPTLMRAAIENLEDKQNPSVAAWREKFNVTDDEIVQISGALAAAQEAFVNAADPVTSFEQALRRYNLYDFRLEVQCLLFASIGEVFCAAWFKAVREVSVVGEESPAAEDMARFSAAVRQFATQHGRPPYDADATAEQLRMWQHVLQYRTQELAAQLQAARKELVTARAELAAVEQRSSAAPTQVSLWRRLFKFLQKDKECPSTGCTKTPHSSGRN